MASGMFSRGKDRTVSEAAEGVEEQIAELRNQIAELARLVARDVAEGADEARGRFSMFRKRARDEASADLDELIASGEEILAELSEKYRGADREVRRTVREHPFATLGAAALAGFVIASILRR